jgi:hypothetical protein
MITFSEQSNRLDLRQMKSKIWVKQDENESWRVSLEQYRCSEQLFFENGVGWGGVVVVVVTTALVNSPLFIIEKVSIIHI